MHIFACSYDHDYELWFINDAPIMTTYDLWLDDTMNLSHYHDLSLKYYRMQRLISYSIPDNR